MAMAVVPSVVFRFLPVVSVLIVASTAQSLEQVSGSSSSPSSLPLTSSVESIAHAAATPSVTCRFDDVASATVVSAVVFEGRVDHVTRTSSADDAVTYAVFRVRTLIKGSLQLSESTSGVTERSIPQYRPVAVALTPIKSCSTEGGVADSMPEMKTGAVYVVFAGEKISVVAQNATSSGGKRRRPVDLLRMLRRPEMSSEATLKAVQQFSSSRYARKPQARISNVGRHAVVNEEERIQLHCRVSGRPEPVVTWMKDDVELELAHDFRLSIRKTRQLNLRPTPPFTGTSRDAIGQSSVAPQRRLCRSLTCGSLRQGSLLRLRSATARDSGLYRCRVNNVIGVANSTAVQVIVNAESTSDAPEKPHSGLCQDHSYCFNGGTCYRMSTINLMFCLCQQGYQGSRCQEKSSAAFQVLENMPETVEKMSPKVADILANVSFVLSSLSLLIVISFVIYFVAKFNGLRSAGRVVEISRHDIQPSPMKQQPAMTNHYLKILR